MSDQANSQTSAEQTFIGVDLGTTNTRVWLVRGNQILQRAIGNFGVRDRARAGESGFSLEAALRDLCQEVCSDQLTNKFGAAQFIAAAGMVTSPLGLREIPHVAAPADWVQLAASVQQHEFPEISKLPFLLVPGVRSGGNEKVLSENSPKNFFDIGEPDVMRGEETLCVGLIETENVVLPQTILNLGSHWKAIQLDAAGRIASSLTSLSGELIFAVQTNTILASAVPPERPASIDFEWLEAGMRAERQAGLARALFAVRLLQLDDAGTPGERLSFLVGAVLAADLDALSERDVLARDKKVLITGGGAVALAWQHALKLSQISARIVSESVLENAYLAGLRRICRL